MEAQKDLGLIPQNSTEGSAPRVVKGWTMDTIRIARKAHKLTQAELAISLGCRQQTISEWEMGMYAPKNAYQKLLDQFFTRMVGGAQEELAVPPSTNRLTPAEDQLAAVDGSFTVTREHLVGALKYMEMSELTEIKINFRQAQQTFTMFGQGAEEAARQLSN